MYCKMLRHGTLISMNDYAAMELLNNIVELWATIRCHSFAKTYNIHVQQDKVHKKHETCKKDTEE